MSLWKCRFRSALEDAVMYLSSRNSGVQIRVNAQDQLLDLYTPIVVFRYFFFNCSPTSNLDASWMSGGCRFQESPPLQSLWLGDTPIVVLQFWFFFFPPLIHMLVGGGRLLATPLAHSHWLGIHLLSEKNLHAMLTTRSHQLNSMRFEFTYLDPKTTFAVVDDENICFYQNGRP